MVVGSEYILTRKSKFSHKIFSQNDLWSKKYE